MPAERRKTKKWFTQSYLLIISGAWLMIAVGCTNAGAIQLPPLPQNQSTSQTTASAPEQTVTNPKTESNSEAEDTSAAPSPTTAATTVPVAVPTTAPTTAPTVVPTVMPTVAPLPGRVVFQFQEGEPGWYTVDDDVMGGVSDSGVSFVFSQTGPEDNIVEEYRLLFSGTMSLENNGGFSSVRSDWEPMDLSGYDGILLRVLGDGKSYRLRIRTTEFGSSISYNALFRTEAEKWRLAYVPFEVMVPTRRGFRMDVGQLDPATVASFGLMLSDKQPGEFALQIDWMRAVTPAEVENLGQLQ